MGSVDEISCKKIVNRLYKDPTEKKRDIIVVIVFRQNSVNYHLAYTDDLLSRLKLNISCFHHHLIVGILFKLVLCVIRVLI